MELVDVFEEVKRAVVVGEDVVVTTEVEVEVMDVELESVPLMKAPYALHPL
jgi:hypothetical protein